MINNMKKTFKILVIVSITALISGGVVYFWQNSKIDNSEDIVVESFESFSDLENDPIVESDVEKNNTSISPQKILTKDNVEVEKLKENTLVEFDAERATMTSSFNPQMPDVANGKLILEIDNNSVEKWYLIPNGISASNIEEKHLLLIDEKCLIHAVRFRNGSCLKYLELHKDGHSTATIYGKVLNNKSIEVSDIILTQ